MCFLISIEVGPVITNEWRNPIVNVELLCDDSNGNNDFQGHGDVTKWHNYKTTERMMYEFVRNTFLAPFFVEWIFTPITTVNTTVIIIIISYFFSFNGKV